MTLMSGSVVCARTPSGTSRAATPTAGCRARQRPRRRSPRSFCRSCCTAKSPRPNRPADIDRIFGRCRGIICQIGSGTFGKQGRERPSKSSACVNRLHAIPEAGLESWAARGFCQSQYLVDNFTGSSSRKTPQNMRFLAYPQISTAAAEATCVTGLNRSPIGPAIHDGVRRGQNRTCGGRWDSRRDEDPLSSVGSVVWCEGRTTHEIFTPPNSATGSGCCRCSGGLAHRMVPILSSPARACRARALSGWLRGYRDAYRRPSAVGIFRPAVHHRKQAGCLGGHRNRSGRARDAGRLHASCRARRQRHQRTKSSGSARCAIWRWLPAWCAYPMSWR